MASVAVSIRAFFDMSEKQLYEIRRGKPVKVYPTTSPTRISGCETTGGVFSSSDPRLLKIAGTTLELFFRTGEDVTTMQYLFSIRPGGVNNYGIALKNETIQFWYGNGNYIVATRPGRLYHLLMVNTEEGSTIYLNGATIRMSANTFSDPLNFILGGLASSYFKGTIHHCRVYDHPIQPALAARLFGNGHPLRIPLQDGLIAEYLPFNLYPARWGSTNDGPDLTATGTVTPTFEEPVYESALTGNAAPVLPPQFVGQLYVDKAAGNVFVSTGTSSALSWKPI